MRAAVDERQLQRRALLGGQGLEGAQQLAGLDAFGGDVARVGLALVIPRAQVGSPNSPTAPTLVPTAAPPLLTMPPAEGWVTFASPMNGLNLSLPGDWTMAPASEPWGYGADTKEDSPWLDRASSADGRLEFFARATDLPRSMTIADWIEAYELETGTCSTPVPWVPVTAPIGEWSMRETCGRFVGLGVVDGVRGIVLSMRPTVQQTTHAQIDAHTELFAAIIGSVGGVARTD